MLPCFAATVDDIRYPPGTRPHPFAMDAEIGALAMTEVAGSAYILFLVEGNAGPFSLHELPCCLFQP